MDATAEVGERCVPAPGGYCHPSDVRSKCLWSTTYDCLEFQHMAPVVHLAGSSTKDARAFVGTYQVACRLGASVRVRRTNFLIDDPACFHGGRALYTHNDDSNIVLWYGKQDSLGGPYRQQGSVYADPGEAWNIGRIERGECDEGGSECRLVAQAVLRAHDKTYLPEQIGMRFASSWERGSSDGWLAWDASVKCWVREPKLSTAAGPLPLTLESVIATCVVAGVIGTFLALKHPVSYKLRFVCRLPLHCFESCLPAACSAPVRLALVLVLATLALVALCAAVQQCTLPAVDPRSSG